MRGAQARGLPGPASPGGPRAVRPARAPRAPPVPAPQPAAPARAAAPAGYAVDSCGDVNAGEDVQRLLGILNRADSCACSLHAFER
jgi:hypothetical protein